jgi:hypothetical protein
LHPDSVGRWTTRKPIDAAPRVRFKSTRTQRQRATPTAFGTIGRLGPHRLWAAPPVRPSQGPAQPSVGWRGSSRPASIGGRPGRHCRQLDSDTGDALAHLALDWHAAQAPVVQRKPGEGSTPETRAPCRQPSAAQNPRTAAAWVPLPAGAFPLGLSQVGLGLICTAPGGIAPRPTRARPCLAPLSPPMGLGNQGQDAPHPTSTWARPAVTQRTSAARADSATDPAAADSRQSDRVSTVDSDNGPGPATGSSSRRRQDRPATSLPKSQIVRP